MPHTMTRRGRILTPMELTVTGALWITLASFVSVSILTDDFKISVAIILLPVFSFLAPDFHTAPTAALSAVGVFLCRTATFYIATHEWSGVFRSFAPEMAFYTCYGLFLSLFHHRWGNNLHGRSSLLLPLLLIDLASNVTELAIRLGTGVFAPVVLLQLAAVALCRSFAAVFILWAFDSYGMRVLRREDAERYQRLLIMTSMLESELYWLEKSANRIETTMVSAYDLYQQLSERAEDGALADTAIDIAKDIHEVKKQYMLITRGIDHTLREATLVEDGMEFSKICGILQSSLTKQNSRACNLHIQCEGFYTRHHYALMSVLHNLLSNAIEAAGGKPADITVRQWRDGERIRIEVADNCGGIDPNYIDQIFLPGFSSKMDPATGVINRGLGLCIVKEIIEAKFGGTITVTSAEDGTAFHISLPRSALEDIA